VHFGSETLGEGFGVMAAKIIHLLAALITIVVAIACAAGLPDLHKDTPTTFGTITGFLTVYGVVFAIIELFRTRAAAELAAREASRASNTVRAFYDLRNVSECQSSIEHTLNDMANNGQVSLSILSRIVKLYVAEFSIEYQDDRSVHRKYIATIESFVFNHPGDRLRFGNLKRVLLGMMANLSVSASARTFQEIDH
jgi:hypothetical protein